jgi:hypothetical protein
MEKFQLRGCRKLRPHRREKKLTLTTRTVVNRRSFMRHSLVAGAATVGAGILANRISPLPRGAGGKLTKGDVAILQFLAAAVIIESVQDVEVATLASKLIPGYPAKATGGNPLYMEDLLPLDRLRAELLRNMGCRGLLNQSVNQPH